jgi:predicted component of type VI protein secretion system/sRNA-binding regulator protein Hfq
MSDASHAVYPEGLPLLTLKGQVSIYFLDGQSLDGELVSQDQFNIFLKVDNEPVMIPRLQIRFIRGQTVEQIEEDDSQPKFAKPEPQFVSASLERVRPERFDTEEYSLSAISQSPVEEDDDTTAVIEPEPEPDATPTAAGEEQEYDQTMVINLDEFPFGDVDDDGTVVIPPGSDQFAWADNDADGTLVLESGRNSFEVDLDATMVQTDQPGSDEEDVTLLIPEPRQAEVTATLTCITGPHAGDVFKLQSGINTVGRSNDNLLVLSKDKEISRRHAIILLESGRFIIQDQNSLNGTFVNDEQISGPHYLEDGDEILVGLSTLKYTLD